MVVRRISGKNQTSQKRRSKRNSKRRGSKRRGSKRRGSKRRGSKRRGSKRRGSKRRGSKRRVSRKKTARRRSIIYKQKGGTTSVKDPNRPTLLIVAGPTGSGKGSLPDKVFEYLNIDKSNGMEKILIDNIVENNTRYKNKVIDIIQKKCSGIPTLCDDLQTSITALDPELIDSFAAAYSDVRFKGDCQSGHTTSRVTSKPAPNHLRPYVTCNNVNDQKLLYALQQKKNIVFETTGEYHSGWIFTGESPRLYDFINDGNYKIIMAWSLTHVDELIKRNKGRALNDMRVFITSLAEPSEASQQHHGEYELTVDGTAAAPRLPDVRTEKYMNAVGQIHKTFGQIIKQCVFNKGDTLTNWDGTKLVPAVGACGETLNSSVKDIQYLVFDNSALLPAASAAADGAGDVRKKKLNEAMIFDSKKIDTFDISNITELLYGEDIGLLSQETDS